MENLVSSFISTLNNQCNPQKQLDEFNRQIEEKADNCSIYPQIVQITKDGYLASTDVPFDINMLVVQDFYKCE